MTYELELPEGADARATQEHVVRTLRSRYEAMGLEGARVYWRDDRYVVVDLPGMDAELAERARAVPTQGPPAGIVLAEQSLFGPSVDP